MRHGLTAASVVLPSDDRAAYEDHRRRFLAECHPATPTETQLVQELIDTSWRLNRIPQLEAQVLPSPENAEELTSDIVDAHRADHGFVFSKDEVERFAARLMRLNEARHIEHVRFYMRSAPAPASR